MKKLKLLLGMLSIALIFGATNVSAQTITEAQDLTLTEDITEQLVIDGAKVTIDLNGHDIKGAINNIIIIKNGAEVTIKGEGTIESTVGQAIHISGSSNVTLESGNVKSKETAIVVVQPSTFTMNDGTITTVDNFGIAGNGSSGVGGYTINFNGGTINANIISAGYISCGIYHPNEGTVNITGGTINSSKGPGIVQRAGLLNITGGTINANGTSEGKAGDAAQYVTSSAVVVDKKSNYPGVATLATKISKNAVLNSDVGNIETLGENVVVEITGGIFIEEPKADELEEGYNAYEILDGENKGKYVVANKEEIVNTVADAMITKEDVAEDTVALIEETIEGKYNLLSFYDVSLIKVTDNDEVIGYVTDATEAVKVTLGLPTELPELKEGFTRKYYVVRIHNGEATVISDVTDNGDGTVSFKSDKFSTYAIAYEDVKVETTNTTSNPQTGDSVISKTIILGISLTGIAGLAISKRKRFN